jgi:hypothetical protein
LTLSVKLAGRAALQPVITLQLWGCRGKPLPGEAGSFCKAKKIGLKSN